MRISDEELMRRCRCGDAGAFELLVSRYQNSIMNFICHVVGDYHKAEDLCQETFVRVFRNARKYKSRNRFKSWIFQIASNLCKNELRYRSRHSSDSLETVLENGSLADLSRIPDILYEKKEKALLVKRAIERLPENQRLAIVMREYESLRYDEIGAALGCSVSAVKSMIHRARQNLRKQLISSGVGEAHNAKL